MLASVVESKEPIRSMFARESLKDEQGCLLDVHKLDPKAAKARALCSTTPYWTSATMCLPLFETFSSVFALLEGDLTPVVSRAAVISLSLRRCGVVWRADKCEMWHAWGSYFSMPVDRR